MFLIGHGFFFSSYESWKQDRFSIYSPSSCLMLLGFCERNVTFLLSVIRFAILHYSFVSKWNEYLQNLVVQVTPMILCILATASNSVFNQTLY